MTTEQQDYARSVSELSALAEEASKQGLAGLHLRVLGGLSNLHVNLTEFSQAQQKSREAITLLESGGATQRYNAGQAQVAYSISQLALGQTASIEVNITQGIETIDRRRDTRLMAQSRVYAMQLYGLMGRLSDYDRTAAEYIELVSSNPAAVVRADIEYRRGNIPEAEELLTSRLKRQDGGLGPNVRMLPVHLQYVSNSAHIGSLFQLMQNDRTFAGLLEYPYERICRKAGLALLGLQLNDDSAVSDGRKELKSVAGHALPMAQVVADRLRGLFAQYQGDTKDAENCFRSALQFSKRAGYRPEAARAAFDYSVLLSEKGTPGDREKAIELQDEAISIATELGMKPLLERVLAKREILKA